MHTLPFDKPGRFWRGNLHSHSVRSDGAYTPDDVCRRYREAGYDFLAITDHFLAEYQYPIVDTRVFRNSRFTTLLGAELHAPMTELGGRWHILAVGLPGDFAEPGPLEDGPTLAQRAIQAGAFVAAAHPQWYSLTERDLDALGQVHAIEVFNGVSIDHNDRYDSWHITDVMLGRSRRYLAYAADDFHGTGGRQDFSRGWVWVKAATLDAEDLLAALKAGHFYSSTGPQIFDVRFTTPKTILVRHGPADRVFASGKGASVVSATPAAAESTELDISRMNSPYVRITVRDRAGGRAWTNPIWLDESSV